MIKKILNFELYWNRANGHLGIPLSIFERVMLLMVFLKLFNIYSLKLTIIIITILLIVMLLIGYADVKYKVYQKQNTINNEHNLELQILLKK